jgi:hypothetical protein
MLSIYFYFIRALVRSFVSASQRCRLWGAVVFGVCRGAVLFGVSFVSAFQRCRSQTFESSVQIQNCEVGLGPAGEMVKVVESPENKADREYARKQVIKKMRKLVCEPDKDFRALTSLHFTSPHFTSLHFTSLHSTPLHFTSLRFTSLCFTSLRFTSLRFASLHFT